MKNCKSSTDHMPCRSNYVISEENKTAMFCQIYDISHIINFTDINT